MQDIPAPPVPPELPPLPDFPVIVDSGPPAVLVATIVAMLAGCVLLWPLVRAWARRLERGSGDPALQEELDHLRARVLEFDQLHQRVAELEERVEFSERLLTQRAPEALPRADQ